MYNTDVSQLCVFVRIVEDFEIWYEFLTILPFKERTTGSIVSEIPMNKLISAPTDGAPAMLGERNECIALPWKSGLFVYL